MERTTRKNHPYFPPPPPLLPSPFCERTSSSSGGGPIFTNRRQPIRPMPIYPYSTCSPDKYRTHDFYFEIVKVWFFFTEMSISPLSSLCSVLLPFQTNTDLELPNSASDAALDTQTYNTVRLR